ncbi:MAG: 4-hydroxybenzoate octaprenyltransferase [Bacteroidetes bacterium GWF2_38_335]|nr:MAG: 4-hydroxybenzoate octaprenyltransferase [Bacteroidetes bacterium GWF2_38_335]OFY79913.1 MAG: 4-hydroxybenzoate octaprenyltransferase [Bacteroidetes bacterium RIFOXYA12_FULL_38_20]HBS86370.1 4-hydroxybenzoate octaprenyltransferase [Bacteroidales bacterium]
MSHQGKIKAVNYLSMVKFSHTIFAMPFAMIGFFLAINTEGYKFKWELLIYVILCMVFARNAAMGFNRYSDRKIDKKNPRTSKRELPSGIIRAKSALWFVIVNALLFIAVTWFINQLVFFLSPVALLVILGYSLTKKFTALCHFILGLGLSLAPIGAYLAVTAEFHILPILFSLIVLTWVSGFDIIYALQDEEFDKSEKLFSIPAYFGKRKALIISSVVHLFSALLVFYAGYYSKAGILYFVGAAVFSALLAYQHLLVKPNDLSRVNLAFMTLNGIASVIYASFTITDLYYPL